jgi:hypothetical protein
MFIFTLYTQRCICSVCAPMFDKTWPSIRLGLLSQHKYIIILNTFSGKADQWREMLYDSGCCTNMLFITIYTILGAYELMPELRRAAVELDKASTKLKDVELKELLTRTADDASDTKSDTPVPNVSCVCLSFFYFLFPFF